MKKKRIIKLISVILTVVIVFVGGFYIASDFGRAPFFYISRATVSSMETENYKSDGSAILSEREEAIMFAAFSGVKLKRIQGDEKKLIGAQDPIVLTVNLRPFGKIRIVFIHVIVDYFDTSKNYDCISINGKIYESVKDYEYMFNNLSYSIADIRHYGHAIELSIKTNRETNNHDSYGNKIY